MMSHVNTETFHVHLEMSFWGWHNHPIANSCSEAKRWVIGWPIKQAAGAAGAAGVALFPVPQKTKTKLCRAANKHANQCSLLRRSAARTLLILCFNACSQHWLVSCMCPRDSTMFLAVLCSNDFTEADERYEIVMLKFQNQNDTVRHKLIWTCRATIAATKLPSLRRCESDSVFLRCEARSHWATEVRKCWTSMEMGNSAVENLITWFSLNRFTRML